ncbi:MAG: helix-turn-helix transcriptional regulator [Muribaculaceae bacterium]|nr:helix-turn-helix transcriptional regulator [Muribaculaceae bacterium]
MDIVSRLKKFLEHAGISNSQFADTCVIPRPTLSQLLNGRNKKVSDEVIAKIHRAYPTLNIMWLLFGDGEMIMGGEDNAQATDKMSAQNPTSEARVDEMGQRAISFEDDDTNGYRPVNRPTQRVATPTSVNEAIQSIMRSSTAGRPRGAASPDARRVVNIMVFYNDGRFEEFGPQQ